MKILSDISIADVIGIVISIITFLYMVIFGQKNIRDWAKKHKNQKENLARLEYLNKIRSDYHQTDIQFVELSKQLSEKLPTVDAWNLEDTIGSPIDKTFFELSKLHPRLLLLGEGGSGKTTLLRKFAFDLASETIQDQNNTNLCVPVIVPLGNYVKVSDLRNLIELQVERVSKELVNYFPNYLKNGNFWFLLDGLDEMPKTGFLEKVEKINRLIQEYSKNKYTISSRDVVYQYKDEKNKAHEKKVKDLFEFPKVFLMPLNREQQKKLLLSYLPDMSDEVYNHVLESDLGEKLLSKPYFFRILGHIYYRDKKIPIKTRDLITSFIPSRIQVEASRIERQSDSVEVLHRSMAHFALNLAVYGYSGSSIPADMFDGWLPDKILIDGKLISYNKKGTREFAKAADLLHEENNGSFRFAHQLIYEHFLDENQNGETFLDYVASRSNQFSDSDQTLILDTIYIATKAHENEIRQSGDKYIYHAIAAGLIMTRYVDPINSEVIAAAIVHDTWMNEGKYLTKVKDKLKANIYELVNDSHHFSLELSNVDKTEDITSTQKKIATLALLEKYSRPAVTIKLVESLHNMQTIRFMSDEKQVRYMKRTRQYYIPLAKHLGYDELAEEFRNVIN